MKTSWKDKFFFFYFLWRGINSYSIFILIFLFFFFFHLPYLPQEFSSLCSYIGGHIHLCINNAPVLYTFCLVFGKEGTFQVLTFPTVFPFLLSQNQIAHRRKRTLYIAVDLKSFPNKQRCNFIKNQHYHGYLHTTKYICLLCSFFV